MRSGGRTGSEARLLVLDHVVRTGSAAFVLYELKQVGAH